MNNTSKMLRDYMLTQGNLTDLVGTRIWADLTYPPESANYKPSQGGAIVFKRRGGETDYTSAVLESSWQFKCYGQTPRNDAETVEDNANAVYFALVDALHGKSALGIWRIELEEEGQTLYEQVRGWAFILCFFETRIKSGLAVPV